MNAFEKLFSSPSGVSVGYVYQGNYNTVKLSEAEQAEVTNSYQRREKLVGEEREQNYIRVQSELRLAREEKRRRNAISLAELVISINKVKFDAIVINYLDKIDTHDFISAEQKKPSGMKCATAARMLCICFCHGATSTRILCVPVLFSMTEACP
ncbi:hypothetical protein K7H94_22695 (plasmid) [Pantoea dispersa]|uniref:hypothetical protein n=1 Tax=Pantoea dispersa TaxID=59814 RepID=UPI001CA77A31|nr:hypothetical protein [Pantoea dispersa]QZY92946.1 hypothetical protein K7H94_22695 [Pantoea dispersa]